MKRNEITLGAELVAIGTDLARAHLGWVRNSLRYSSGIVTKITPTNIKGRLYGVRPATVVTIQTAEGKEFDREGRDLYPLAKVEERLKYLEALEKERSQSEKMRAELEAEVRKIFKGRLGERVMLRVTGDRWSYVLELRAYGDKKLVLAMARALAGERLLDSSPVD